MKKIILTFLLIILFVAGCSSGAKRQEIMEGWEGGTRSHLIERWGPPSSIFDYIGDNGKSYEVLTYSKYWSDAYGALHECKTSFYLNKSRIERWRYEGCAG